MPRLRCDLEEAGEEGVISLALAPVLHACLAAIIPLWRWERLALGVFGSLLRSVVLILRPRMCPVNPSGPGKLGHGWHFTMVAASEPVMPLSGGYLGPNLHPGQRGAQWAGESAPKCLLLGPGSSVGLLSCWDMNR